MAKKGIFILALYRNKEAGLRFKANAAEDWIEQNSEMRGLFVRLRTNGWTNNKSFFRAVSLKGEVSL